MPHLDDLYGGDADGLTRVLFGENARRAPAWLYIQNQGEGIVSFVGASKQPDGTPHPLRFGSRRTHQLLIGEIVVRPAAAIATDARRGAGIGGLLTDPFGPGVPGMLDQGELLFGRPDAFR